MESWGSSTYKVTGLLFTMMSSFYFPKINVFRTINSIFLWESVLYKVHVPGTLLFPKWKRVTEKDFKWRSSWYRPGSYLPLSL